MIIDTHAHIDMFENPEMIINNALEADVKKIIVPGVEPSTFNKIVDLVNDNERLYGALGVHPSEAGKFNDDAAKRMIDLAHNPKIVAIGEVGLDYHFEKETASLQKKVFASQIDIAKMLNLPLLIHDRDAHGDTMQILEDNKAQRVLMHCFSGSVELAEICTKKGYKIAIGGVVTFKNAKNIKQVVEKISLDDILLETDCPYLAPHPFRGEQNEPKYLTFIAKEIANIKDLPLKTVIDKTTQNAIEFFNI